MKRFRLVSAFLLGSFFMFQACDDGLLDVIETFTFTHEFPVQTTETNYSVADIINLAEKQALIDQYGSKIKNIELQEVKYWIKDFNGPDTQEITSLVLSVADPDGSDSKSIANLENVALAPLVNTPTLLTINSEGKTKLENRIKKPPHTFSYMLNLDLNEGPADFTVAVEIKIRMTANPLN